MAKQAWQVKAEEADTRLDKWLAAPTRLGSRGKAFDAIASGKIFVNDIDQTSNDAGRKLIAGDTVRVWMDRPGSAKQRIFSERKVSDLHIIYEDNALLVINKPAGLLTVKLGKHPDEVSLFDQVCDYVRPHSKVKPQIVHRIDRDTSGLVVFAKTQEAREGLKKQFMSHRAERKYRAIVYGIPFPEQGTWRDWLIWDNEELVQRPADIRDQRSVEAKSHYRVLEKFAVSSLLEVQLVTGKQNQIRVQAAMHGHQLIGEKQYADMHPPTQKIPSPRQALHAAYLRLTHPNNNRSIEFSAPLPEDLTKLLIKLRQK